MKTMPRCHAWGRRYMEGKHLFGLEMSGSTHYRFMWTFIIWNICRNLLINRYFSPCDTFLTCVFLCLYSCMSGQTRRQTRIFLHWGMVHMWADLWGRKEGRYIRTTGGISGFGMFLKTKIPKYTQQTKVLLTKSEHIFILVAFIQKEEVFTGIPSPRLKDERSGHRSK